MIDGIARNEFEDKISKRDEEILRLAILKHEISAHNRKSRLINCRGLGMCYWDLE